MLNAKLLTKFFDNLILEWSTIIYDDCFRDSISTDEVIQDELRNLFAIGEGEGYGLHPFSELFSGGYYELVAIR